VHRVLRVARTIADLDGRARVSDQDINAAVLLRETATIPAAKAA
jgi:predicted ATPase with chaperone activity